MRHKFWMFVGSAVLTLVLGASGVPVEASEGTSLLECLKDGGHASGKYCSGGLQDGKLIVA